MPVSLTFPAKVLNEANADGTIGTGGTVEDLKLCADVICIS